MIVIPYRLVLFEDIADTILASSLLNGELQKGLLQLDAARVVNLLIHKSNPLRQPPRQYNINVLMKQDLVIILAGTDNDKSLGNHLDWSEPLC